MMNYAANEWKQYKKAVYGFVVALVAALVAEVNSGTHLDVKALLLALGTAVVTGGTVYQARNEVQP